MIGETSQNILNDLKYFSRHSSIKKQLIVGASFGHPSHYKGFSDNRYVGKSFGYLHVLWTNSNSIGEVGVTPKLGQSRKSRLCRSHAS